MLQYREHTTYLGIILDDKLQWKEQLTELNKKIVKYTGIFSKYRYILPLKCRIILYNAFVFSRVNYGVGLYVNSYPKSHLDNLKVTQSEILKILQLKRKSHTNDLYKDFNVLKN